MTSSEKKNKRKGIIGTILFHALLLVAFLFLGLKYQDPPPAEEGISINFGYSDEGMGEDEPEDIEEITEIVEEEVIEEQIQSTEEIITQTEVETPAVEKTEKEEVLNEEEPKEEVIQEKKPEVNKKALYPGKKKSNNTSEGEKGGDGNQGVIDGDPNADVYEGGGIGEDGTAYQLGGRKVEFKAKPIYNTQVEGTVVVLITVDRLGNVINAIPGAKGSTTLNKQLLQRAKAAALKTKFDPKQTAPTNQQGKIIYHFSLN
ncbi:MAG: energy transducer TonB [Flavobacteriales bacterium]|nr:energy transducer TonB [Flavobacteriales bacterium]